MSNEVNDYIYLLNLDYSSAVKKLISKYGQVNDDYFIEESYNNFLNGEITTIARGNYKRTFEGLYCHHVGENKVENMANFDFIKKFRIPYFYHQKKNLVYANLTEHMILHLLIMKETNCEFGSNGYSAYIRPMFENYMIKEIDPEPVWMQACKKAAYLSKSDAEKLLDYIDNEYLKNILTLEEVE